MCENRMSRFENQCALVTGAAGGIGQAIVARLRKEGATVAVADRASTVLFIQWVEQARVLRLRH